MQEANNNGLLKDKTILGLSIAVFFYLAFLVLSYKLKFDSLVIIGVIRESLDIPALFLLAFLLVLSGLSFIKGKLKFKSYAFYSIVILSIALIAMVILL